MVIALLTCARPRRSSPGAVSRRRNTFGERIWSVARVGRPEPAPVVRAHDDREVGAEDGLEGASDRHGSRVRRVAASR